MDQLLTQQLSTMHSHVDTLRRDQRAAARIAGRPVLPTGSPRRRRGPNADVDDGSLDEDALAVLSRARALVAAANEIELPDFTKLFGGQGGGAAASTGAAAGSAGAAGASPRRRGLQRKRSKRSLKRQASERRAMMQARDSGTTTPSGGTSPLRPDSHTAAHNNNNNNNSSSSSASVVAPDSIDAAMDSISVGAGSASPQPSGAASVAGSYTTNFSRSSAPYTRVRQQPCCVVLPAGPSLFLITLTSCDTHCNRTVHSVASLQARGASHRRAASCMEARQSCPGTHMKRGECCAALLDTPAAAPLALLTVVLPLLVKQRCTVHAP